MITRTLFIFGCLSLGFTFPVDENPTLEVIQAKEIHLPQQVVLTKDVVKEPFLPTPAPSEPSNTASGSDSQTQPAEAIGRIAPPVSPAEPTDEQGEDLAPPLDAQNVGDKTDLDTANTFWGGYGGYGGYGGWGWRRPYYGGWGRGFGGWGGGYGGWGGYGWGGRSYYRPWGWGGWRW